MVKMFRRWHHFPFFVLIFALISRSLATGGPPAHAQTEDFTLVYTNLENSVVLFRSAEESYNTLIQSQIGRSYTYQMVLAPDGDFVAIYTNSFELEAFRRGDNSTQQHSLRVYRLPEGEMILERDLLPASYIFPPANGAEAGTQSAELTLAFDEISWSPDSKRLLWIEGIESGDATLFMLNTVDNSVAALPDEPGYPDQLHWSPDGSKVVYTGVVSFGGGANIRKNGAYSISLESGASEKLAFATDVDRFWLVDWASDTAILWSPFDATAGAAGLFLYDTATQTSRELISPQQLFSIPVWDRATETVAFAVPDLTVFGLTQTGLDPGAYFLPDLESNPVQVSTATNLFGVEFPVSGYLAVGNDILIHLSDRTEFTLNEMRWAHYSPDGLTALGERTSQTVLRTLASGEERIANGLFFVEGMWIDSTRFVAKVGAYGSVIGWGSLSGPFTNLVEDAGNGPFVAVMR